MHLIQLNLLNKIFPDIHTCFHISELLFREFCTHTEWSINFSTRVFTYKLFRDKTKYNNDHLILFELAIIPVGYFRSLSLSTLKIRGYDLRESSPEVNFCFYWKDSNRCQLGLIGFQFSMIWLRVILNWKCHVRVRERFNGFYTITFHDVSIQVSIFLGGGKRWKLFGVEARRVILKYTIRTPTSLVPTSTHRISYIDMREFELE